MLGQKKYILFCFVIIFIIGMVDQSVSAETIYVDECLDENPNCLEDMTADKGESVSNNELVESLNTVDNKSLMFNFIKMILTLLLILGLIYFLLKFLSKKQRFSNRTKNLENLGGISVGQNRSIQLIRLGQQIYLIGVGENVELLKEINDEKLIDDLVQNHEETEISTHHPLKTILGKFLFKKDQSSDDNDKFVKLFSQELDKLKNTRTQFKDQQHRKEHENE